ncbi:outer envelope pore protein 37, chloroplastic [Gossypium australe]|uniref:Outer envelope pore protein 37, chloroplastic n=1 Tax=Gossypium australe TaxID=47621 RepID=A0A5B6W3J9_9ROSI|nr:outer envelope pore protein 37, chloroplastic [Gossypium australe]
MLEPSSQTPDYLISPITPPAPPSPPPPPTKPNPFLSLISNRPSLRVTSEFDSDNRVFFHKVSCKLFDDLAKLKLSFVNNVKREISEPLLALTSKHLSIHYDPEEQNALIKTSFDVGPKLQFKAAHDVKAKRGEVAMIANVADPGYAVEVSSPVPYIGLPKATIRFPTGEVTLEEREDEEVPSKLLINGILKGPILNGVGAAHYTDEELRLRYSYKDESLSFIPSISLPSNAVSFAFKRRFSPSDKLSYWYNFDSNCWSAVYKHTYDKDFKFKAGYDSEVRLGWASLWVGEENGKAKTAPMKMKVQFMLQVPQDDIKSSALMFRVKKRWDIL